MIIGTGIDIVDIGRIRDICDRRGADFLGRVYHRREIEYSKGFKKELFYSSLAARFAAKEALIKALGERRGLSLKDMEVVSGPEGRPSFNCEGRLGDVLVKMGASSLHLSLSYEKAHAVAFVVMEG